MKVFRFLVKLRTKYLCRKLGVKNQASIEELITYLMSGNFRQTKIPAEFASIALQSEIASKFLFKETISDYICSKCSKSGYFSYYNPINSIVKVSGYFNKYIHNDKNLVTLDYTKYHKILLYDDLKMDESDFYYFLLLLNRNVKLTLNNSPDPSSVQISKQEKLICHLITNQKSDSLKSLKDLEDLSLKLIQCKV